MAWEKDSWVPVELLEDMKAKLGLKKLNRRHCPQPRDNIGEQWKKTFSPAVQKDFVLLFFSYNVRDPFTLVKGKERNNWFRVAWQADPIEDSWPWKG